MSNRLERNLAILTLGLIALTIVSYMATMDALVFWTNWGGQIEEIGGVLDYQMFGQSAIYHVTKDNAKGRLLFTFLDFPLYFLVALAFINAAALFSTKAGKAEHNNNGVRRLAAGNLVLGVVCIFLYAWGTMMFIDNSLKFNAQIGGSVYYMFPLYIWITHVYQGHIESFPNWHTIDFTLWILLVMFAFTLFMLRRQLQGEN